MSSSLVEKVQEVMQQQLEMNKKNVQQQMQKTDAQKRESVQDFEELDYITINPDAEKEQNESDQEQDEEEKPEEGEDLDRDADPRTARNKVKHIDVTV